MMDFKDRHFVVTGASGGIGGALARMLARAGARLVLCDLEQAAVDALAQDLLQSGAASDEQILACALDVSDARACTRALEQAASRFGSVNGLVNSAGIYPEQLVRDMSDEQWRRLMAINLDGTFYMCRAAIPHLAEGSAIVNLSSLAGHRGSYSHAHYSASKGGVSSLSKSLALELAPRTRVNLVAPGIIQTHMTDQLIGQKGDALLQSTPLRRYGSAAEVASVIAFLCSDLASFVTGETIHVNGGLYIV